MERSRDQLLAGAALAADEHRHVGVGHPLDQFAGPPPSARMVEEHAECRLRLQLLAQRGDFSRQLVLLERVGQRHFELDFVERLADEIGRAELHRLHDGRGAALAGQHDDRHVAVDLLNAASASSPSILPGITTSRMTAAGRSASYRLTASSALLTVMA